MSSGSSVRLLVSPALASGYIVAVETVEWPRPKAWPISCVAISCTSIAVAVPSVAQA